MKPIRILYAFAMLLAPAVSRAQAPAAPKGATAIVLHLPDSAQVGYKSAVQGLLAAGHGLDRNDAGALFVSSTAKPVGTSTTVKLQVVTQPEPGGSRITIRGLFTLTTAATLMAGVAAREYPIRSMGNNARSGPGPQTWNEMQRVALLMAPNATVTYQQE